MFDLAKSSPLFERMDGEHPTLVQNIDIVNENRLSLDATYHKPKHFILSLNNLLRSLLFFIESSIKNSPIWLKESVSQFKENNRKNYEILRYLRNVSAHQKLIFPRESLVMGLFRIYSEREYKLKLGHGEHNKPGSYARDIALKNTAEIFDDLLSFPSIAFMDLEHSAFGECLGITRRWFYKVDYKFESEHVREAIDVYAVTTNFSSSLLDHVCSSYAIKEATQFEKPFTIKRADHNNVNTLLELDLYPSLFSKWWKGEITPLNFGVSEDRKRGRQHIVSDEYYTWVYDHLTETPRNYTEKLLKFAKLEPEAIFKEEHVMDFLSFVTNNHWHFKKAFPDGFTKFELAPSKVMTLQRLGRAFLDEQRTGKSCAINKAKVQLNDHIAEILKAFASEAKPTHKIPVR